MSTKRARYDGPYEEVAVYDSQAGVYAEPVDIVQRGGLLSTDVAARIRDDLLAADEWSEVKRADDKDSDS